MAEKPNSSNQGSDLIKNDPFAKGFNGMMGPQMAELEAKLEDSLKSLDDMNSQMQEERDKKKKAETQKHVPQPLKNDGQSLKSIARRVKGLLSYSNFPLEYQEKPEIKPDFAAEINEALNEMNKEFTKMAQKPLDEEGEKTLEITESTENTQTVEDESDGEFDDESLEEAYLPELSEFEQTQLLSHSLAGFVSRLSPLHRERFYKRIINDTTKWITSIFRVKDSTAMYSDEPSSGLYNVIRLAICSKYPEYTEKGYECLYARPPVIYISEAAPSDLKNNICMALGLPASCICVVPCKHPEPGQVHKMDTDKLERLMNDHLSSTRQPILVIAYASTPQLAQVDSLQKIKGICKVKDIWLHIEGLNLAMLCLMSVPTDMLAARTSDSCTLDLSSWFGFVACPAVTLYRKEAVLDAEKLNLDRQACETRLVCFSLWVILQAVGVDGLVDRVKTAVNMTESVLRKLSSIPSMSILNKKPTTTQKGQTSTEFKGLGHLLSQVISSILVFELATPVIIFRYSYKEDKTPEQATFLSEQEQSEEKDIQTRDKNQYDDSLNTWFVETINRELPALRLEGLKIDNYGTAIKFSPLERSATVTESIVEVFLSLAEQQLRIMNTTASHRQAFKQVVEAQDNLRYVLVPGWAGIGALQYIPTEYLESLNNLSDKAKYEINKINIEIVHQLKKNDTAFTLGRTADDLSCARFGLISEECDLEELLGLVYTTGKEIEESSKFVEQMAELVKKGIEEANKDLVKENESKLAQEGVFRQVPLFGSLVNWWAGSPIKETSMKGRTFNLSSGKIKTTEDTYKHHMQIEEQSDTPPQKKAPLKTILKSPVNSAEQSTKSSISEEPTDISNNAHQIDKEVSPAHSSSSNTTTSGDSTVTDRSSTTAASTEPGPNSKSTPA